MAALARREPPGIPHPCVPAWSPHACSPPRLRGPVDTLPREEVSRRWGRASKDHWLATSANSRSSASALVNAQLPRSYCGSSHRATVAMSPPRRYGMI
ncbi:hypothetical protein BS78_06G001300 [Paspalum vaginatum]|nr:hypothetical protein BS78_06G001300 [Paspalum vaginatum]